jgi:type VI protein secretion system component VasF
MMVELEAERDQVNQQINQQNPTKRSKWWRDWKVWVFFCVLAVVFVCLYAILGLRSRSRHQLTEI